MERRQDPDQPVIRQKLEDSGEITKVREQILVRQRHRLGHALGSAGEQYHRRIPYRHAAQHPPPPKPGPEPGTQLCACPNRTAQILHQHEPGLQLAQSSRLRLDFLDHPSGRQHGLDTQ